MADEEEHDASQDEGPGAAYNHFSQMEDLSDKLKLLKYDQGFLKKSSAYKPVSKYNFASFSDQLKNMIFLQALFLNFYESWWTIFHIHEPLRLADSENREREIRNAARGND